MQLLAKLSEKPPCYNYMVNSWAGKSMETE